MEKTISPKLIEKMAKDIETLQNEILKLRVSDKEKTDQIKDLRNSDKEKTTQRKDLRSEIEQLKKQSVQQNNNNLSFEMSDNATIIGNTEYNTINTNLMDITWVSSQKDVLANNLKNLVIIMDEICNTQYQKNKTLNMIPLLQANEKEFQVLEEYIIQNKISIKFILYPTRKEYIYHKDGEVKNIAKKPKAYKFGNTVAIKFDGSKFAKVPVPNFDFEDK